MGTKLTHSLDIINSFGELKVVVPLTTAQIPGALETLKARKQHYLDERAKVCRQGMQWDALLNARPMVSCLCVTDICQRYWTVVPRCPYCHARRTSVC